MATTLKQISMGSSGAEVLFLQKGLNIIGAFGIAEDGVFGSATKAAVESYQQWRNIAVDGIVGPQTWAALQADMASAGVSFPSVSPPAIPPRVLPLGVSAPTAKIALPFIGEVDWKVVILVGVLAYFTFDTLFATAKEK